MPRRTTFEVVELSQTPRGFRVGDRITRVDVGTEAPERTRHYVVTGDEFLYADRYCVHARRTNDPGNTYVYLFYVGRFELTSATPSLSVPSPKDTVHKIGVPKKPLP